MKKQTCFEIKIDIARCKGCELCLVFCPKKAIKKSKEHSGSGVYFIEIEDITACTGCLSCALMCPECAITITKKD